MTGDEIRDARERRGWTQERLAAAIGVGKRTVGNWERGDTVPRNRMAKLREVLGADLETVGPDDQDDGVMLNLPPEALEGLDAMQREEVAAAARLSALERAREIRRRLDS